MTELEIALNLLLANNITNSPAYWINAINTGVFDSVNVQQLILNTADYVEINPALTEILKRWNGTAWVAAARVNRIEAGTNSSMPYSYLPTLSPRAGMTLSYSYQIIDHI